MSRRRRSSKPFSGMSTREYASHSDVKNPNRLCVGFKKLNMLLLCSRPAKPAFAQHSGVSRGAIELLHPSNGNRRAGLALAKKTIKNQQSQKEHTELHFGHSDHPKQMPSLGSKTPMRMRCICMLTKTFTKLPMGWESTASPVRKFFPLRATNCAVKRMRSSSNRVRPSGTCTCPTKEQPSTSLSSKDELMLDSTHLCKDCAGRHISRSKRYVCFLQTCQR